MMRVLIICMLTFVLLPFAPQTHAQALDAAAIKPLPDITMPQADFEAATIPQKETPFEDKFLSYSVRLPKDWSKVRLDTTPGVDMNKKLLGQVARYYGPSLLDDRSSFIIQASSLDYDITVKDWLLNYVLSNGYVLQGMNTISPTRIESIFIKLEKDVSYIVRAVTEINGSRIVLAMYSIPESQWEKEKGMQASVIKSFHFLTPEKASAEDRKSYAFLDLLRFEYPASWRLQAPSIFSADIMDAKLINSVDGASLNGEIDIHVVSTELDTTLAAEVQQLQKAIEDRNFVIGDMVEEIEGITSPGHVTFSRVEVYKATDKNGLLLDHEYWIAVMMEDRYFYIVTMLTPARKADFFNWARNNQAFKTVLESFRP